MGFTKMTERESYRLIQLSASDDSDSETANLPDLNLPLPSQQSQNNSGVRRKIRLKRKDRDRLSGPAGSSGNNSDASSRDFVVSSSTFGCSSARSALTWLAVVLGLALLVVLAFLTAKLHMRLTSMELDLIGVMEERNGFRDQFQVLNKAYKDIISNQTDLAKNVSIAQGNLFLLSSQSRNISQIVSQLSNSLKAAPELVSLPGAVEDLKKNVAQFGSRLTEIETKIEKSKDRSLNARALSDITLEWKESMDNTTYQLRHELNELGNRLTSVGKEIASQLQEEEKHSAKSLDVIEKLQQSLEELENKFHSIESCCSKPTLDESVKT